MLVGQAREGRASVLPNAAFSCLGYVTFGDNRSSGFRVKLAVVGRWWSLLDIKRLTTSYVQTRELKSIPLNVSCRFIKLRFHQNHINHLNPFNQVGWVDEMVRCVQVSAGMSQSCTLVGGCGGSECHWRGNKGYTSAADGPQQGGGA